MNKIGWKPDEEHQVWTLNDFYTFYSRLVPNRVYQIHQGWNGNSRMHDGKERYINVKEKYGDIPIVVQEDCGYVNQTFFNNEDAFKRFEN